MAQRWGAAIVVAALLAWSAACSGGGFVQRFEYEEDVYLELNGAAEIYVNGSAAAMNALRGASFDTAPTATIARETVSAFFTTPVTRVTRITQSRRSGRRFLHVRLDTDHLGSLSEAEPLSWSTYRFEKDGNLFVYRQTVGASAGRDVGDVGWTGQERVAFRLHLPSTVVYHNAGAEGLKRGNILVWEQALADRLRGEPLAFDARIEDQSILSRTLVLFGATVVVVALMFGLVIWVVVRRGGRQR